MVFKAQLFSVMNGQDSSIENLIGDYAENESEKESKEAESKVSKTMEEQKWLRTFDLLNNSSLTFSKYISSASLKGLPSISLEIETPPPDFTV